nr:50S ribosomal protein L32 [Dermatophilus congolensis]
MVTPIQRRGTDVAVPKRKMSRSNTRSRRAQWKTTVSTLASCPTCTQPKRPHVACPSCGVYNGRHYAAAERSELQD